MSNHLTRDIDLYQVRRKQDIAVCSLNTLSLLLDAYAADLKSNKCFESGELACGISGLLKLLATDLNDAACDIFVLHDQLRHEGVRP
ncbi:hypothetical protein [Aeromonas enteropelogenes]|uniref:hypothetical protein n=1 Tax=Aeromonas enteropelogenes TaxID=29489 RepID=UPI0038D12C09